ncbi:DUF61 family protein [Sulfolobus acidocaldarius]|uniref:Conserved Crenarchaeal protein n=4 Tax=Sulfolobus acidocaldarius TaxID=2285 RepID=Q4J959_SULAC|nr:DUF61 family protein [Sulfolobus acidocaldarius]AAY80680.1 conserved Crenarchaeal protein [Sulfolobus acidocaldarius DSM 639]AGE71277.1 hypothetical protein SacN8_06560 [Sulfolobus acidocaldarius N8]AGE73546.1 hypothetical protein SacRon12I_06550 [Sulfolobus acidocaldarius Ron12/I]ALU30462.1 hypothetical protein ATY89_11275 [Sulfolobus acidocaldarius]ALU31184.1 hypothetical protein ATZ20_02830 [Sulfolobus acidocaldarius]
MIDKVFDLGFKSLLSYYPDEFVTLKDALNGKLSIRLKSKDLRHRFDKLEVEKLSQVLPIYLWDLVKLPFIVVKTLNTGEYAVSGSQWEVRSLSIILQKEIKNTFLSTGDVEKLIKEYKSLIFITISSVGNIITEEGRDGYYF